MTQLISSILFFISSFALAQPASYDLKTDDGYHLGPWIPDTITFTTARSKIDSLDQWYGSLPEATQKAQTENYNVNRNRLFITAQYLRLKAATEESQTLGKGAKAVITWTKKNLLPKPVDDGTLSTKDEEMERVAALNELLKQGVLENSKILKLNPIESLTGISKIAVRSGLPNRFKLSRSLNQTISKTNSGPSNHFYSSMSPSPSFEPMFHGLFRNPLEFISRKPLSCKEQSQTDHPPLMEYFDQKKYPKESQLLHKLGIKSPPKNLPNRIDLSDQYDPRIYQYDHGIKQLPNGKCVGNAIAADMNYELNKNPLRASRMVSGDDVYAIAKSSEDELFTGKPSISASTSCDIDLGPTEPEAEGIVSTLTAYNELQKHQVCAKPKLPWIKTNPVKISGVAFLEYTNDHISAAEDGTIVEIKPGSVEQNLNPDFIRMLIEAKHPPAAIIDNDHRSESEDWLEIEPTRSNGPRHAINIVGYGKGFDPFSLCEKEYFIVIDSLGKKKIPYKVSVEGFMPHLLGLYKAMNVL